MGTNTGLTADELQQLPVRAIIAICVRSAIRVRPTFDLPGTIPNRGQLMAAVDTAIGIARDFAAGQDVPHNAAEIVKAAMAASGDAPPNIFGTAATMAGMTALLALMWTRSEYELIPNRAAFCLRVGGNAAAARADYQRLTELQLGPFPNLGQPIDASERGPLGQLWPERTA